ncbi:pyruvate dehydrogenase (acetyl-transferring), homodimeric type, partial [Burkholderia multivorans]
ADPYQVPYYHPGPDDEAIEYLIERRRRLGGFVPQRRNARSAITLPAVSEKAFAQTKKGSGQQKAATTMAFVRLLKDLMREKGVGERIVPIIPDEARTFGIDAFFPTAKIYNPNGQNYLAVDRELFLSYKEASSGQLLPVGINEAGAAAGFTAAVTAYSTHGQPMIP